MSEAIDTLIRGLLRLDGQLARLTNEQKHLRAQLAALLGPCEAYTGVPGVVVRKVPKRRYEVNARLLQQVLSPDDLEHFKVLTFTKAMCEQAQAAGHLPTVLYDAAVRCVDLGWHIQLERTPAPPEGSV